MEQTEARERAREHNKLTWTHWTATTICASLGEYEEGPDANKWIVVAGDRLVVDEHGRETKPFPSGTDLHHDPR